MVPLSSATMTSIVHDIVTSVGNKPIGTAIDNTTVQPNHSQTVDVMKGESLNGAKTMTLPVTSDKVSGNMASILVKDVGKMFTLPVVLPQTPSADDRLTSSNLQIKTVNLSNFNVIRKACDIQSGNNVIAIPMEENNTQGCNQYSLKPTVSMKTVHNNNTKTASPSNKNGGKSIAKTPQGLLSVPSDEQIDIRKCTVRIKANVALESNAPETVINKCNSNVNGSENVMDIEKKITDFVVKHTSADDDENKLICTNEDCDHDMDSMDTTIEKVTRGMF